MFDSTFVFSEEKQRKYLLKSRRDGFLKPFLPVFEVFSPLHLGLLQHL